MASTAWTTVPCAVSISTGNSGCRRSVWSNSVKRVLPSGRKNHSIPCGFQQGFYEDTEVLLIIDNEDLGGSHRTSCSSCAHGRLRRWTSHTPWARRGG